MISANVKRELNEMYMFLGCVNHNFARKRWLRCLDNLSFCSYKGLPRGSWHCARWGPKRVTEAGLCDVNDLGQGGVREITE
jgi:hypothetical protein